MAVARKEPALQLMTVDQSTSATTACSRRMIKRLLEEPLDTVARSEEIQQAFGPLQKGHTEYVALVRTHAVSRGDAIVVDLTDKPLDVASKFVTYALYPGSLYSIAPHTLEHQGSQDLDRL